MNKIELDSNNNIVIQNSDECTVIQNKYSYERRSIFNENAYNDARASWEHSMKEYNKLNWFKRLITQKPLEPNPASFLTL